MTTQSRRKSSLRRRLVRYQFLAISIPVLIAAIWGASLATGRLEDQLQQRIRSATAGVAQELSEKRRELVAAAESMADSQLVWKLIEDPDGLLTFNRTWSKVIQLSHAEVLDVEGKLIQSLTSPASRSLPEPVGSAIRSRLGTGTASFLSSGVDGLELQALVPVRTPTEELVGYVLARQILDRRMLISIRERYGVEATIMDVDRIWATTMQAEEAVRGDALFDWVGDRGAASAPVGTVLAREIGEATYLLSTVPEQSSEGGAVVLALSSEVAEAAARSSWGIYALLAVVLLSGSYLVSRRISRRITEPVEALHQFVEQVGTGDLDRRVSEEWIDEFGTLARSLNQMTLRLQENTTSIETLQRVIEGRERAEQQLRQSQKMEAVGRLAGGIAHDFNNILVVVLGYGELLRNKLPADSKEAESARQICDAAERAALLVKQLLAFGRKQQITPRLVNPDQVIAETWSLLQRLVGETVQLDHRRSETNARVLIDPVQLEQVLINMTLNARDAMPEGGTLSMSVHKECVTGEAENEIAELSPGEYVRIEIEDSGCGMSAAVLEQIFEPFFTTKEADKGTGLGLAVSHGIIAQAGGTIRVRSAPGEGTRFSVYLPELPEPQRDDRNRSTSLQAKGESVLVVDDEPAVRELARLTLAELGYRVRSAGDPERALDILQSEEGDFDLLLTDLVMPRHSGHELAREARSRRPKLQLLFMSGYSADSPRSGETGVETLGKPFTPTELAAAVRRTLDLAAASEDL